MNKKALLAHLPIWTLVAPITGWIFFAGEKFDLGFVFLLCQGLALIAAVLAAVHHAEVVAHRVGEPLGSLLLAVAVTTIEVALIVELMHMGGADASVLARDTVFAAEMIIINGIIGLCLLIGGLKHREQSFSLDGVSAALTVLVAISVLTLILPNFTTSIPGPFYSSKQLAFVAIVSFVLYGTFLAMQNIRHKDHFVSKEEVVHHGHAGKPSNQITIISAILLLVALSAVVLLAEALAPEIEEAVVAAGAPKSIVGIIIAMVVLLPEGIASVQAARKNKLQASLNLALGSALASIGFTIPTVAFVSLYMHLPLTLGIDTKSTVLFLLSLFVIMLSLKTGKTTLLQGVVLLVIFAVYLFTTMVP